MAWYNASWLYRKSVTYSRASGAVTNYQMLMLIGESSGAVGEDVDCGGNCKTDFGDLRFTAADGTTLLDYWIERVTGTTPNQLARVWVELDSVGTSATTFYMYYGNSGASTTSSGSNTFITYDDFERGIDGDTVGGSWTEVQAHCHISTEQDIGDDTGYFGTRGLKMIGHTTSPNCTIPVTNSANISIRWRYYKEDAATMDAYHGDGTNLAGFEFQADEDIVVYDGASWVDTGSNCSADAWGLVEVNNFDWSGLTCDVWYDDVKIATGADISYASSLYTNEFGLFGPSVIGDDAWLDDFIVRHFRSVELVAYSHQHTTLYS
jgi:hypothetical protein